MNQKLSDWASIAEILSSIAVVVTLLFLVFGIRENTEITRIAAYDRNMESVNLWRYELAKDAGLVRLFGTFNRRLSEEATDAEVELFQLNLLLNALWGTYEKSYYAYQYGILGSSEWSRFEIQMCRGRELALEAGVWEFMVPLWTEEFANYVASLCPGSQTSR